MHEATEDLILASTATADLAADVVRAESSAGEPFLHPGEDPEHVLANGTARRRALDAALAEEEEPEPELSPEEDPGAKRRYRFRHPTASGKTIAAAGFVEAARTLGVLILTHRRLLVSQFDRELKAEGYGDRLTPAIERGKEPLRGNPLTIQTYAWFARHADSVSRDAYQPL